jgi:ribonuclease BN (tRNA processing enzyme)
MEVRLLGSGGWLPTDLRETACVYIREGADVLLLDAGTGFRRLVTEPSLLDGVERLHIALTHLHLDHTAGLVGLAGVASVPAREVWAPGRIVAAGSAEEVIHRLLDPPFLGKSSEEMIDKLLTDVRELDGDAAIGPFQVEVRIQQRHTSPTLALKVNGELAYCTDTAYDEGNVAFARGARILLHEAFHAADETDDAIHAAAGEAARIAAAAEVERLVCVHLNPLLGDEAALRRFAEAHFRASEVGSDGLALHWNR